MRQAHELLNIAKEYKNSSSLIYACLDSRIALELCDLNILLVSVKPEDRQQVIDESKPKNGIEKTNKKVGSLKERYQLFVEAVCEVLSVEGKYYDYKRSKELQHLLSSYIHSYYLNNDELHYDSEIMQAVFKIISDVNSFIYNSLVYENSCYSYLGIEIKSIPKEDKCLLDEWKSDFKMDVELLKERLKQNYFNRTINDF